MQPLKTLIFVLSNGYKPHNQIRVTTTLANTDLSKLTFREIEQTAFDKSYKQIFDLSINYQAEQIKQKMISNAVALGTAFSLAFGLKTGDDDLFLGKDKKSSHYKPLLRGANIHRYERTFDSEYVWYVPDKMIEHRKTARPGTAERFEQPKVLIRDTGGALEGTYDDEGYYVKDVLVVSLLPSNVALLKYLCGILNSRLMKFYYETSFPTLHVQRDELASLPIKLDFSDPADKARHDKMVSLVERMLSLHNPHRSSTTSPKSKKDLGEAGGGRTPQEQEMVKREIKSTDREIDQLVYELYGLSEDEIKIVEGG